MPKGACLWEKTLLSKKKIRKEIETDGDDLGQNFTRITLKIKEGMAIAQSFKRITTRIEKKERKRNNNFPMKLK